MRLQDIDNFEENNDISVYVFWLDEYSVSLRPLRPSKVNKSKKVELLLTSNDANKHYLLMRKGLSPFISKTDHKVYPCHCCLHAFWKEELRNSASRIVWFIPHPRWTCWATCEIRESLQTSQTSLRDICWFRKHAAEDPNGSAWPRWIVDY